jgi:hypothetical protein
VMTARARESTDRARQVAFDDHADAAARAA